MADISHLVVNDFAEIFQRLLVHLGQGFVDASGNNELRVYSTVDDPPALRLGAPTGSVGKLSGNLIRQLPDGTWRDEELVLLQFKHSEAERGTNPLVLSGEVTLHLRDGRASGDGMVKVLEIRHDTIWTPWTGYLRLGAAQAENYPSDAFATALRALYVRYMRRPPTLAELEAHRGNPGGLDAVEAMLIGA